MGYLDEPIEQVAQDTRKLIWWCFALSVSVLGLFGAVIGLITVLVWR